MLNKRQAVVPGTVSAPAAGVDRETLMALKASMGASFSQLASYFTEDLDLYREQIIKEHAAGRFAELRRIAHTLKSSSQMFGCGALSALAREFEAAALRNDISGAAVEQLTSSMKLHVAEIKSLQLALG